jgi:hypothetical protein
VPKSNALKWWRDRSVPPSIRNSWPHFAFLTVTAIVMYFAKWPILLIAALIGFYRGDVSQRIEEAARWRVHGQAVIPRPKLET